MGPPERNTGTTKNQAITDFGIICFLLRVCFILCLSQELVRLDPRSFAEKNPLERRISLALEVNGALPARIVGSVSVRVL